jgi:hypothetical protein
MSPGHRSSHGTPRMYNHIIHLPTGSSDRLVELAAMSTLLLVAGL